MPITTNFTEETNGSVTLTIDLKDYLPIFRDINDPSKKDDPSVKTAFQTAYNELIAKVTSINIANLVEEMYDFALKQYPLEIQQTLRDTPAFSNLYDSCPELIKNAIDAFLQHHLQDPTNPVTTIQFNTKIEDLSTHTRITFSDSGPGFHPEKLHHWRDESHQLDYMKKHRKSHKKESNIRGLLGGKSYGMRQLICQTLVGEALHPGKIQTKPDNFDAAIQFGNGTSTLPGATIQITTQKQPLTQPVSSKSPELGFELSLGEPPKISPSPKKSKCPPNRISPESIVEIDTALGDQGPAYNSHKIGTLPFSPIISRKKPNTSTSTREAHQIKATRLTKAFKTFKGTISENPSPKSTRRPGSH